MLQISLAPDGRLRLIFPSSHRVDIAVSEAGALLLASVIQHYEQGETKIGSDGAPTQAQVLQALLGDGWGEEKQLAGDRKRWSEIKASTGVKIRVFDEKGRQKNLSLEDIGL